MVVIFACYRQILSFYEYLLLIYHMFEFIIRPFESFIVIDLLICHLQPITLRNEIMRVLFGR